MEHVLNLINACWKTAHLDDLFDDAPGKRILFTLASMSPSPPHLRGRVFFVSSSFFFDLVNLAVFSNMKEKYDYRIELMTDQDVRKL